MILLLRWTKNKNRKYGKANGDYQNAKVIRYLTKTHGELSDTTANIAASKVKIEAKKEGIKKNLVSSYVTEEKDVSKR